MEPLAALDAANAEFERRLRLVTPDDWARPTPCSEWDVRALVNHVIGANVRYAMLLEGASTAVVEATRSVDHLGDDPVGAFLATAAGMKAAFDEPGAMKRVTHHVNGDRTGADLLRMRVLDIAVHAWDLARAVGVDETLEPALVGVALTAADLVESSRPHGSFATPAHASTPSGASAQARLLHLVGR